MLCVSTRNLKGGQCNFSNIRGTSVLNANLRRGHCNFLNIRGTLCINMKPQGWSVYFTLFIKWTRHKVRKYMGWAGGERPIWHLYWCLCYNVNDICFLNFLDIPMLCMAGFPHFTCIISFLLTCNPTRQCHSGSFLLGYVTHKHSDQEVVLLVGIDLEHKIDLRFYNWLCLHGGF